MRRSRMSLEEGFGVEPGERGVEGQHEHAVEAEFAQTVRLGVARGEAEDGGRAREEIGGMRLEGEHGAGPPQLPRQGFGAKDDRAVAAMYAVEIADGDRPRPPGRRRRRGSTLRTNFSDFMDPPDDEIASAPLTDADA